MHGSGQPGCHIDARQGREALSDRRNRSRCRRTPLRCPVRHLLASRRRAAHPAGNGAEHAAHVQRLGDVIVHADGQGAFAITRHGVGCHGNHRQVLQGCVGADVPCGLVAVHHRHLAVHQHAVKTGVVRQQVQRLAAVGGELHLDPGMAQQLQREFLVEFVVFHQQQALAGKLVHGVLAVLPHEPGAMLGEALAVDGRANGIEQLVGHDGLGQHRTQGDALALGLIERLFPAIGRDHDGGRHMEQLPVMHVAQGFNAVHLGHLPVDQHQVVGLALLRCPGHGLQGCAAIGRGMHLQAQALRNASGNLAGTGVVIHHQHAHVLQGVAFQPAGGLCRVLQAEPRREVEFGPLARFAANPDSPAHLLHQRPGDGQPQAGAAIAARGGAVGLAERLEQFVALLGGHANTGVAHPEVQFNAKVIAQVFFNTDDDLAVLGELDGVVAQVDQNLPQAQRVTHQVLRNVGRHVEQQLQPFVLGLDSNQVGEVLHHLVQPEPGLLDHHLARLDLGKIKDVVDDAQQADGGAVCLFDIVALARVERRLQRQM